MPVIYTTKRDRYLYALVLEEGASEPVQLDMAYPCVDEMNHHMRTLYNGKAKIVTKAAFQAEVERRQVHSDQILALLKQQEGIYGFSVERYYVYGSLSRPMSGTGATWGLPDSTVIINTIDHATTGFHSYVVAPEKLDKEKIEHLNLQFVSGPKKDV